MDTTPRSSTPRGARALVAVALACFAVFAAAGGTASAATPAPLKAAREALVLSNARLELMDEVMASKWFTHSPIQDPVQEAAVKEGAAGKAEALGVAGAGTRALFGAEIEAAKDVELGWGSHWLYYGAPAGMVGPDLGQLRAQLGQISEEIVAVLPRLVRLSKLPGAEARVARMAATVLTVGYLSAEGRKGIVDALLGLRRAGPVS